MKLLDTYALECGIKPPAASHKFPTVFYPLPDRYITLSPKSGQSAKDYEYFDIVVSLLHPILEHVGIKIIQLGVQAEPQIPGTIKPHLSLRQSAHGIKNSLCHLTVDTMSAHLAGGFGTPIVEVFGSTAACNTAPYYSGKHIYLEGYETLPSYKAEEAVKAVNSIKPEIVAQAVLDILEIKQTIPVKTKFIGDKYKFQCIELIPNFRPDYSTLPNCVINVRMDQFHNEQILAEMVQHYAGQFAVTLNKPLSKGFPFHKFAHVNYLFSDDYKKEDLQKFDKTGIPTTFIYIGGEVNKVRLDLESPFNFPFINCLSEPQKVEVDENTRFNSRRQFMSGGQMFGSLWHAKHGVPGSLISGAKDSEDFWLNVDNFHIFS